MNKIRLLIIISVALFGGLLIGAVVNPGAAQEDVAVQANAPLGSNFSCQGYLEDGGAPADESLLFLILQLDCRAKPC